MALWLSAINVKYRDINYVLPFLTQFWFFITPVAYSATAVSEKWQMVYALNPMAGVVTGFRWALLGIGDGPTAGFWLSVGISIVILISGLFYFRGMEKTFADTISAMATAISVKGLGKRYRIGRGPDQVPLWNVPGCAG